MEGKQYQIKDIMDKFYISRDTVKYFEEKGLITSTRNESGYRVYEEADLQKVKGILDLRELGYSYEEIREIGFKEDFEAELGLLKHLREEAEEQVQQLNERLYKMRLYEQWLYENHSFFDEIKLDTDFRICVPDDKEYTTGSVRQFLARDMKYAVLSEDGEIVTLEDKKAVWVKGSRRNKKCESCKAGKRIEYGTIFRGIRICNTRKELEEFIKEIYEKAEGRGFQPKREAYCIERAVRKEERDYISFDVCMPIEE